MIYDLTVSLFVKFVERARIQRGYAWFEEGERAFCDRWKEGAEL